MDTIYLNHAGTSWPKPSVVTEAVAAAMETSPRHWPSLFERAHHSVCRYFGISNPAQLLLTPGCTSAISVAISDFNWEPNDKVLTSSWEHHALSRPLQKLQGDGIELVVVPPDSSSPFDLTFFESSLAAGGVKLVAITAACNVTGQILPMRQIIELAHKYNAFVLVDAAQVVGWLPLNFSELGADLIAFGGHKGLQSPWGIGGLYIADHVPMKCVTASCGLSLGDDEPLLSPRPGYCDVGSVDQFSLAGLEVAIDWLEEKARADRLAIGRECVQRFRDLLSAFANVTLFGADDLSQQLPTVAFSVAGISSATVSNLLKARGIVAASGFQCAPQAHETLGTEESGVVRLSFGIGQPEKEIAVALERTSDVIRSLTES
ncbi:aminotransferase class V-fold PLP-dependent enzyme [Thalassoglobus polymorphus]|uniref:Putative cysteine desulfurase n=1 Tax=Thalassoglobus polymorphus TaxID=2527994 RepID=A0A517QIF5_9PLAN|nr:aminotransferase class V-fold PLP-dependent enzyme [Thalassoglobus polymorphus]QDT31418.1 putative cysteine desulfurase [Thalassoglobus polymorphus]